MIIPVNSVARSYRRSHFSRCSPASVDGFGSFGLKKSSMLGGAFGFSESAFVPLYVRMTLPEPSRSSIVTFSAGCFST